MKCSKTTVNQYEIIKSNTGHNEKCQAMDQKLLGNDQEMKKDMEQNDMKWPLLV